MQSKIPFGWKYPKETLSWGKLVLDFEEEKEKEGCLKRRNRFHLHSSHLFLLFLIFWVVFPLSMR